MSKREDGLVIEVLDKQKNVLGTYTYTAVNKPDTYVVVCTDKDGKEFTVTKEITKADVAMLLTQAFNINVRNYIAGKARPSKPSKLKAYEAFFAEHDINVEGLDTEKLIEKLKPLEEKAFKALQDLIADGNFNAVKLWFEYMHGKPKERIQADVTHMNNDLSQLTYAELQKLIKSDNTGSKEGTGKA